MTQRRDWLRSCSASLVASLLTVAMAGVAWAESEGEPLEDEFAKWQFSAGVELGLYGTGGEGDVSGSLLTGPRATNINPINGDEGPNVVADQRDSQRALASGLLGGNFGVMTPALFDTPSHPRLFLGVSILPAITLETSVVRDGDPGKFRLPDDVPPAPPFIPERLVLGSGTDLTSQHQGVQFRADLGMAFTIFEFEEGSLRIKPSLHYSRTENKVSGIAKRAVRLFDNDSRDPLTNKVIRSLDNFRTIDLSDEFTEVYHGVGPAFELEYVTQEAFGPFGMSLFFKATATAILGDRETKLATSNPDFPDETVSFRFENDPWSYSASLGVRLLFSPDLHLFR